MGGGDVHVVEMRVFWLFLIRMSPFAHLLSLHRLLKCYFNQKCQNQWKKGEKTVSPHIPCPASQTLSMGLLFLFSRGFCHFVSPTMLVAYLFVFLFIQGCNTPSRKCTTYSWRIQPIFVQYSLQPTISFERGSNCAEHAINLSNMCLYFYIFTKVQYTIHCRKQGCFQDA